VTGVKQLGSSQHSRYWPTLVKTKPALQVMLWSITVKEYQSENIHRASEVLTVARIIGIVANERVIALAFEFLVQFCRRSCHGLVSGFRRRREA
jgi:hypothetical protein